MEEESERAARQTGGGVGWQNIWRLTAGMCRNQGMNNWKGDGERDRNTERKKETESKQKSAGRGGLGQPSPISLLGLFVSSIDQIKFLLPVYSTRAMSSPRSTPSPAHSPSPAQNHPPSLCPLYDFAQLWRAFFCFTTERFMLSILARAGPFCECSSQIKSKQLFFHFVNEPSTAISNFTAMNPCGFWSGRDQQKSGGGVHSEGSKGLERRIDMSAKDWRAYKHGIFCQWPLNFAIKALAWLQETNFLLPVGTDFFMAHYIYHIQSVILFNMRRWKKSCAQIMRLHSDKKSLIFQKI